MYFYNKYIFFVLFYLKWTEVGCSLWENSEIWGGTMVVSPTRLLKGAGKVSLHTRLLEEWLCSMEAQALTWVNWVHVTPSVSQCLTGKLCLLLYFGSFHLDSRYISHSSKHFKLKKLSQGNCISYLVTAKYIVCYRLATWRRASTIDAGRTSVTLVRREMLQGSSHSALEGICHPPA